MLDSRKRPAAFTGEFLASKRRKTSSSSQSDQESPPPLPPSTRSVVALLALTDPAIVASVMHFIPMSRERTRGEHTRVMRTVVSLCRAVAPFDRALPRHFGPQNQAFWQGMVMRCFDFSTRDTSRNPPMESLTAPQEASLPSLAVWNRMGVAFVPSEYGYLHKLQSIQAHTSAWPRKENAFTLFRDLALLVDTLRGAAANKTQPWFVPCLRRAGAIDVRPDRPSQKNGGNRTLPFVSRVRRSRRQQFEYAVTTQLQSWTHFRSLENGAGDGLGRIDFYAGPSRLSNRWIGLTSVRRRAERDQHEGEEKE
jgi:hypothetical protein